jgi:predicted dehydrogenase
MSSSTLRIGLIGAGANTRTRHIPGFLALPDVQLAAVCNRRPESTAAVARSYNIPRTYGNWEDLVADAEVDAVVIGTWPYLHCPITLAALAAGKHVLTEARMSMNAAEAHRMLAAARLAPHLVTQIVPSPYGLKGHAVMRELIDGGFLGELREVQVLHLTGALADPAAPLAWRQDEGLSDVRHPARDAVALGSVARPGAGPGARFHPVTHRPRQRRAPAGRHAGPITGTCPIGERGARRLSL